MNPPQCDNLDAYLCGWLSQQEATAFEGHLADCAACREEAQQQGRIDRLLGFRGQGAGRVEAVPSSLVDGIEGRIRRLRRRRMVRAVWGTSAAAALVVALGVYFLGQHAATSVEPEPAVAKKRAPATSGDEIPAPGQLASNDRPAVRVKLADPSKGILMPVETTSPKVSIVWVYPTVKPAGPPRGSATP